MKQKIQGMIVGIVIGAIAAGGIAYAQSARRTIEVMYDNIKVYKDNVLCELKDSNGSTIEPFIYDGTTYLPVRGSASLAGMEVTWDGNTKSVYLWDKIVPSGTSFMEVCEPYYLDSVGEYYSSDGGSFSMAGENYSNGIVLWYPGSHALFNLNGKYSTIECTIGHTNNYEDRKSISFIVDGKPVKTIELEEECLPKKVSIPLNHGLQLKIITNNGDGYYSANVGVGNITVQ